MGPCSRARELHAESLAAKVAAPLRKEEVCRGLARYESNQTTYNTTFLRYELSRLEFFPAHLSLFSVFELHNQDKCHYNVWVLRDLGRLTLSEIAANASKSDLLILSVAE